MNVIKGPAFVTTMAYVAVGISVLATAVSAYGAYSNAEAQKEQMDYNAKVEEIKAKDAANIGANDAADTRARARKIISTQIEAGSLSGLDMNYGTPLGLLVETAGLGEKEALTTMNNAQRQAWGHRSQAELDKFAGQAAMTAGTISAAGSILGGASSTYGVGQKSKLWQ